MRPVLEQSRSHLQCSLIRSISSPNAARLDAYFAAASAPQHDKWLVIKLMLM